MRDLWRRRDFQLLMAGQSLSMFADTALLLVLGMWAKQLTGSTAAAGGILLAGTLPQLFAPLGGMLIDRVRRRRLMIATSLGSAGVVLSLLYVSRPADLWLCYVVAFLYGASLIILQSARLGLLNTMLPPDQLGPANAFLRTSREALRLCGPIVGAGLFAAFGGHAVAVIDAAAFLGAALVLMRLRVREPRPRRAERHWVAEATAGLRHLWAVDTLRELGTIAVIVLLVFGCYETVFIEVVDEGLHKPVTYLGVLSTAQGIGAVIGGLSAGWAIRRIGELRLIAIGFSLAGTGVLLCCSDSVPVVLAGCAVAGAGLPLCLIGMDTTLQLRTPPELQGRVGTALEVVTGVPFATSMAIGASVIGFVDHRLMLGVMGGVTLLAGGYGMVRLGRSAPPTLAAEDALGDPAAPGPTEEPAQARREQPRPAAW
ncbi:MFS transporter [Carbonactinospora thermoautotrophica]|uniref:MFS transporter n=1 Tax=Carbonactinospora thermoautotrophica TaxID=1469144 RepID=UPI0008360032|nr:MFS transporter [Carbonactinospora thermoautotrophica]